MSGPQLVGMSGKGHDLSLDWISRTLYVVENAGEPAASRIMGYHMDQDLYTPIINSTNRNIRAVISDPYARYLHHVGSLSADQDWRYFQHWLLSEETIRYVPHWPSDKVSASRVSDTGIDPHFPWSRYTNDLKGKSSQKTSGPKYVSCGFKNRFLCLWVLLQLFVVRKLDFNQAHRQD